MPLTGITVFFVSMLVLYNAEEGKTRDGRRACGKR
jgi:hypothetical protein